MKGGGAHHKQIPASGPAHTPYSMLFPLQQLFVHDAMDSSPPLISPSALMCHANHGRLASSHPHGMCHANHGPGGGGHFARTLDRVLFPLPFLPMIACTSPSRTTRSTPCRMACPVATILASSPLTSSSTLPPAVVDAKHRTDDRLRMRRSIGDEAAHEVGGRCANRAVGVRDMCSIILMGIYKSRRANTTQRKIFGCNSTTQSVQPCKKMWGR